MPQTNPQPVALTACPAPIAGLSLRAAPSGALTVDRVAGTIKGVAVITIGTTKTSGNGVDPFDVDQVALQQITEAVNACEIGVKSRITHPEIRGGDDLLHRLGYVSDAWIDGQTVRALMTFHNPDDPDAVRLMDIAEKDPGSCGLSIKADDAHLSPSQTTPTGLALRISRLDSVDWVGDPAANPGGMLSAYRRPRTPGRPVTLQNQEPLAMNQKQIEFLITQGLPVDYTAEQLTAFVANLDDAKRGQLTALADQPATPATGTVTPPAAAVAANADEDDAGKAKKPAVAANADEDDADKAKKPVAASAAPAAAPATATPVALTQADFDTGVQTALSNERARSAEIRRIALNTHQPAGWADTQINAGTPIGDVRTIALNAIHRSPGDMSLSVVVGSDLGRDGLEDAIQDGILLRASHGRHRFPKLDQDGQVMLSSDHRTLQTRDPHARARDFRGRRLVDIGRRYLIALGYREADNMGDQAMGSLLMNRTALAAALPGVYLAHGTGDFPYLLADAMGKVLRDAYQLAPTTWQLWCNRTTAPDFKDIKKMQLGAAPDLVEIPEGDDYEYGTVIESKEVYALSTFGKGLNFTNRSMINDDLSAFDRFPRQMGQAAARKIESIAIAILTANAAMNDGNALFSTANANLTTGTLSVTSLGALRAAMRKQTALGSDEPLDLTPSYLLVPEAKYVQAAQLTASAVDPALANATPNPFGPGGQNPLVPISSPRLDANSTTQYYGIASPDQVDTVDVCFLEGQEAPQVEEEREFDTKNLKVTVTQHAQAKAIDPRGMARSSGS